MHGGRVGCGRGRMPSGGGSFHSVCCYLLLGGCPTVFGRIAAQPSLPHPVPRAPPTLPTIPRRPPPSTAPPPSFTQPPPPPPPHLLALRRLLRGLADGLQVDTRRLGLVARAAVANTRRLDQVG